MRWLRAAALHFAVVFGTGFALGMIRVPWLVPRVGVRWAELIELPLMMFASGLSARWVLRRIRLPTARAQLLTGASALVLMVTAELLLAWALFGRAPSAVILDRDPVSGPAYALALIWFALAPWALGGRWRRPFDTLSPTVVSDGRDHASGSRLP